MSTFKFKASFLGLLTGRLEQSKYEQGGTALMLETEMEDCPGEFEPWARVSVCLPETQQLPDGVFYAKDWSENEGLPEQLVQLGLIELAPEFPQAQSGFVSGIRAYRLCAPAKADA